MQTQQMTEEYAMYESKLRSAELDKLFEAILKLKTAEECYAHFLRTCARYPNSNRCRSVSRSRSFSKTGIPAMIFLLRQAQARPRSAREPLLVYGTGGYKTIIGRL